MSVNLIITVNCLPWAGDAAWGSPAARSFASTVGEACGGRTRPEKNERELSWAGDESGGVPKRFCLRQNFWGGEDSAGPAQRIAMRK